MAFLRAVGAFNIGTGAAGTTVEVNISDPDAGAFQPKALILWWAGRTEAVDSRGNIDMKYGIGFATGPSAFRAVTVQVDAAANPSATDRYHTDAACIATLSTTGALSGAAKLQSFDTDGFTLEILTQFATNVRVGYLAIGGDDVQAVATGAFQEPAATGDQNITAVGFQPSAVIFATVGLNVAPPAGATEAMIAVGVAAGATPSNAVSVVRGRDAVATTSNTRYTKSGTCIAANVLTASGVDMRAAVTAWLSNGFTLNWVERASDRYIHYLAIKGPQATVGNFLTSVTLGATIAESSFGYGPKAVLIGGTVEAENTEDTTTGGWWSALGAAASPSARHAQATFYANSVTGGQSAAGVEHDEMYLALSGSATIDALVDLQSFDADGFTGIMDDADTSAKFVWYLALGPALPATPNVLGMGIGVAAGGGSSWAL